MAYVYRGKTSDRVRDRKHVFTSQSVLQPCGTPAAYRRHKYHGEPVCDACRLAYNDNIAEFSARKYGRRRGLGKNPVHGKGCGTPNGYAAHRRAKEPVCDPCRDARNAYKRERDRIRREAAGGVVRAYTRPANINAGYREVAA